MICIGLSISWKFREKYHFKNGNPISMSAKRASMWKSFSKSHRTKESHR
jgi:hypothetical protein